MTVLLSKAGAKLSVKQLLDTLQETLDFEAYIGRKYATPVRCIIQVSALTNARLIPGIRYSEGVTTRGGYTGFEDDFFCLRTPHGRIH